MPDIAKNQFVKIINSKLKNARNIKTIAILILFLPVLIVGIKFSINTIQKASTRGTSSILNGGFEGEVVDASFESSNGVCPNYVELSLNSRKSFISSIFADNLDDSSNNVLGTKSESLNVVNDTFVDKWKPDTNAGYVTEISVRPGVRFSLLKFDLDKFKGTNISKAKLKLYVDARTNANTLWVRVRKAEGSWEENKVTWNTKPKMSKKIYAESSAISDINKYVEIDITDLVKELVSGTDYGIYLESYSTGQVQYNFYSREYTTSGWAFSPKLLITYSGETSTPPITVPDTDSGDSDGIKKGRDDTETGDTDWDDNRHDDRNDNDNNQEDDDVVGIPDNETVSGIDENNGNGDNQTSRYTLPEPVRKDTVNASGLMIARSDVNDAQKWLDRNPGINMILINVSWADTDDSWSGVKRQLDNLKPGNKVIIRLLSSGYDAFKTLPNGQKYDAYVPKRIAEDSKYMIYVNDGNTCSAWRLNYLSEDTIKEMRKWTRSFAKEFKNDDRVIGVVYGPGAAGEAKPWMTTYATACSVDAWKNAFVNSPTKYKENSDPRFTFDYIVPVVSEIGEEWKDVRKDITVQTSSAYVFPFLGEAWRKYLGKYRVGVQESGLYPIQTGCRMPYDKRYNRIYMHLQYPKYTEIDFDFHMHTSWLQAEALGWGYPSNREYHHFYEKYVSPRALWAWTFRNAISRRNRRIMLWMTNNPNDPKAGSWYKLPQDLIRFGNKYLGIPPKDNDTVWITFKGGPPDNTYVCYDYFNYTYGMKTDLEVANRWSTKNSADLANWSKSREFSDLSKSTGSDKDDWRYYSARYIDGNILIDVDDEWVRKLGNDKVKLSMVWLDNDKGTFDIIYAGKNGTTKLVTVKKNSTGKWVKSSWIIDEPVFNGVIADSNSSLPNYLKPKWPNGFDLMLNDNGDGKDIISELYLTRVRRTADGDDGGVNTGADTNKNDTDGIEQGKKICKVGTVGKNWERYGDTSIAQRFEVTNKVSSNGNHSQQVYASGKGVGIKYSNGVYLSKNRDYTLSLDALVEKGGLRIKVVDRVASSVIREKVVNRNNDWGNVVINVPGDDKVYDLYLLSNIDGENDFYIDNVNIIESATENQGHHDDNINANIGLDSDGIESLDTDADGGAKNVTVNVDDNVITVFDRGLLGQNLSPRSYQVVNNNELYKSFLIDLNPGIYRFADKNLFWVYDNGNNKWDFSGDAVGNVKKITDGIEISKRGRVVQYIDKNKFSTGGRYRMTINYSTYDFNQGYNDQAYAVFNLMVVYKDSDKFFKNSTSLVKETVKQNKTNAVVSSDFTYNPDGGRDISYIRLATGLKQKRFDNQPGKMIINSVSIYRLDDNGNLTGDNLVKDSKFSDLKVTSQSYPVRSGDLKNFLNLAKSTNSDFIYLLSPAIIKPESCNSGKCNTSESALEREILNSPDLIKLVNNANQVIQYSKDIGKPIKYIEIGAEPEIWWGDLDWGYTRGLDYYDRYKTYGKIYSKIAGKIRKRHPDVKIIAYIGYSEGWKDGLKGFWDGYTPNDPDDPSIAVPKPDFWNSHSYILRSWGYGNACPDLNTCVYNAVENYGENVYCDKSENEIKFLSSNGTIYKLNRGTVNKLINDKDYNHLNEVQKAIQSYKFVDALYQCSTQFLKAQKGYNDVEFISTEWEISGSTDIAWGTPADELFTADMLGRYAKLGIKKLTHFSTFGGHSIISSYGNVSPPYLTFKLFGKYIVGTELLDTKNDNENTITSYIFRNRNDKKLYYVIVNRNINKGSAKVNVSLPNGYKVDGEQVKMYVVSCTGDGCLYKQDGSTLNGVNVNYRNAIGILDQVKPKVINIKDGINVRNGSWVLVEVPYDFGNDDSTGTSCDRNYDASIQILDIKQYERKTPSVKVTGKITIADEIPLNTKYNLIRIGDNNGIVSKVVIKHDLLASSPTEFYFNDTSNINDEIVTANEFPINSKIKYLLELDVPNCDRDYVYESNEKEVFSPQGILYDYNNDCKLTGWVRDQDVASRPTYVQVYIDREMGINDTPNVRTLANLYDESLESKFGGRDFAYHKFSIDMQPYIYDGNSHELYIYAENIEGTKGEPTKQVKGSPVTIQCKKTFVEPAPEDDTKDLIIYARRENHNSNRNPRIAVIYSGDNFEQINNPDLGTVVVDSGDTQGYKLKIPANVTYDELLFDYNNDYYSRDTGEDVNVVINGVKLDDKIYTEFSAKYCKFNFFDEEARLHMHCGGDFYIYGNEFIEQSVRGYSEIIGNVPNYKKAKLSVLLNDRLVDTVSLNSLEPNYTRHLRVPVIGGIAQHANLVFRFDNDYYKPDPYADLNAVVDYVVYNDKICRVFYGDNDNCFSSLQDGNGAKMSCNVGVRVDLEACE